MNRAMVEAKMAERFGREWDFIKERSSVRDNLDYLSYCDRKGLEDYHYKYTEDHIVKEAEHMLNPMNVKVGDGVTICLWSDRHAATVTKVTKTSVTVRQDKATLDPNFKPEFIVGGFAAHCTNQSDQTYTYEEDPNGNEYTFRWSHKYGQYGQPNDARLIKGRHEFYDYNF